jgi:hypothetical protein
MPEMTLSVVVTVVDGGDVLRRFLRALTHQNDAPAMQILLPYDASVPEIAAMASEFPQVTSVDMGQSKTLRPISTAAGQHELYDRRRAAGLALATGELIAILEDRAPPRPNWASTAVRLHRELLYGCIGGAIECAPGDLLNWSFYVCDFSRYSLPFASGPRQWVSDVNVTYKREMMDDTRSVWRERFNEALVHWTLLERGETLYLSNELIVDYQTPYSSLLGVLPERFHWGRLFGSVRARSVPAWKRALFILLGPLIPTRLVVRHGITQMKKGNVARYVLASPYIAALVTAWAFGEWIGYLTREP